MTEPPATIDAPRARSRAGQLSRIEVDMIDIFVRIARFFGVSKSVGEIYGLLFISPAPVTLDYVRTKLNLSSGSASQGLRLLRTLGAVHATYVPGDRRDYFLAETALRKITGGFLREKVAHDFIANEEQFERLTELLEEIHPIHRDCIESRIHILRNWRRQARAVLPMVMSELETESPS